MLPSKPLSYDCTRHIIKHTDPNTRLSLSLRCPSIQAFEKSVPFKCRKLQFKENEIIINDVNYTFDLFLRDSKCWLQLTVKLQNTTTVPEAHAYLMSFLFGGRNETIKVKRLEVNVAILRLPKFVKLLCKEVDVRLATSFKFDQLYKIMDGSSFPLNLCLIRYNSNYSTTFEHPLFRSALRVFIRNKNTSHLGFFRRLLELPNENIVVQSRLSLITFQTIIENWRRTQRKVGTTLTIKGIHTEDVEKFLNRILGQPRYRENDNGDLIIHLYEDKELRILSGDIHKELPTNPKLWNDFKNFLRLEVIDVDSE